MFTNEPTNPDVADDRPLFMEQGVSAVEKRLDLLSEAVFKHLDTLRPLLPEPTALDGEKSRNPEVPRVHRRLYTIEDRLNDLAHHVERATAFLRDGSDLPSFFSGEKGVDEDRGISARSYGR